MSRMLSLFSFVSLLMLLVGANAKYLQCEDLDRTNASLVYAINKDSNNEDILLGCAGKVAFAACTINMENNNDREECRFVWPSYSAGVQVEHCSPNLSSAVRFAGLADAEHNECVFALDPKFAANPDAVFAVYYEEYYSPYNVYRAHWRLQEDQEQEVQLEQDCYVWGVRFSSASRLATVHNSREALACHRACVHLELCRFWTWTRRTSTCHLFDIGAIKNFVRERDSRGVVSAPKMCPGCFQLDKKAEDSPVSRLRVENENQCLDACRRSRNCNYFTFFNNNDSGSNCRLLTNKKGQNPLSGAFSGPRDCRQDCFERNVAYMGFDLATERQIASPLTCQRLCQRRTDCHYWTLNKERRLCYLKSKNARKGYRRFVNRSSGPKFCENCYQNDVELVGDEANLAAIFAGDIFDCRQKCLRSDQCRNFNYVRNTCILNKGSEPDLVYDQGNVLGLINCPNAQWSVWGEWRRCSCWTRRRTRMRVCVNIDNNNNDNFDHNKNDNEDSENDDIACGEEGEESEECSEKDLKKAGCNDEQIQGFAGDTGGHGTIVSSPMKVVPILLGLLVLATFALSTLLVTRQVRNKASNSDLKRDMSMSQGNSMTAVKLSNLVSSVEQGILPCEDEYVRLNNLDFELNVARNSREVGKSQNSVSNSPNRYANIIPYDKNRVILENTEYINASWIRTENLETKFVAAQAPMMHTLPHFLAMITEHRVNLIIMLTKVEERNREGDLESKCQIYWPDNTKDKLLVDEFEVLLEREPEYLMEGVKERCLVIKTKGIEHRLVQLHYTEWPDFGVPVSPHVLVQLGLDVLRRDAEAAIVHCSAGVGRSGTFIALLDLLKQLDDGNNEMVDIFETVLKLRAQRMLMVQKSVQYSFLYHCLAFRLRQMSSKALEADYVYGTIID